MQKEDIKFQKLRDEIYDKAQSDYRLGKQLFDLKLKNFYMIDFEVLKATQQKIKLKGDKFNIKEFHNKLLSYGNIPFFNV